MDQLSLYIEESTELLSLYIQERIVIEQALLCLSILAILLLVVLLFRTRKTKAAPQQPQNTFSMSQSAPSSGISPEVVAAITAAVAAVWDGEQGFTVKHIKRINNAPTWNRAGREEQIYSRM